MDIVRRLYPLRKGRRTKVFKSGAVLDGNMDETPGGGADFNGYGVFTWANGDTYLGDWESGQRGGVGIFRSHDGKEYAGQWKGGLRHGWGTVTAANGEECVAALNS